MWIEKLADGVLEIDTPIGPRYLRPSFAQRASLLWTFRNFPSLPQQVLCLREQRLIERLWSDHRFVSVSANEGPTQPIIGRVERRMTAQAEPVAVRKPLMSAQTAVAEQGREAASA
jgi:hypothetical protein